MKKVLVGMCVYIGDSVVEIGETLGKFHSGSQELIALDSTVVVQDPISHEAFEAAVPSFSSSSVDLTENLLDLNSGSQEIVAFDSMAFLHEQNSR